MKFKVNRELLTLKFLYFFELSIIASLFIYMTPFMSEWGVTATEMAIINVVANIFALFARPLFGYLADKYQKYKQMLMILSLVCAIVYSLHLATPKHVAPRVYSLTKSYKLNISVEQNILIIYSTHKFNNYCWPTNLSQCHINDRTNLNLQFAPEQTNSSYANYVPLTGNFTFDALPSSLSCKNVTSICENSTSPFTFSSKNGGLTWSSTFWILGILKTLSFCVYSPLVSLTDAVTFVTLGPENTHKFGFTRMFGTIGVLVFSIIMAGVLKLVNLLASINTWIWISQMQQYSQFVSCFIMATIILALLMVTISFLRIKGQIKSDNFIKRKPSISQFLEITSLNLLFQNCEISVFFAFAALGGFLLQVFAEFFFLTLFQRHPTLPKYFPGFITVVMTLSESLVFGLSSHILRHNNYEIWISVSFLFWSARWFLYIFLDNFWFHLVVELLHGPSFGLMLSCMMAHVCKFATVNTQGRIQGLFSGIFFNIGGVFGGFFGGIILDNFGMFGLFKSMSALALVCGIYYPLQRFIIRRNCAPRTKINESIKINGTDDFTNDKALLAMDTQIPT